MINTSPFSIIKTLSPASSYLKTIESLGIDSNFTLRTRKSIYSDTSWNKEKKKFLYRACLM
jgi:hypothetical protein